MGTLQQWIRGFFAELKLNSNRHRSGQRAEELAAEYLKKKGLKLITKNYTTRLGEIDLVMQDQTMLVFVEVKYRVKSEWATAVESVTRQKQQRLIKAAKQYLQQHQSQRQPSCRFDVVAIDFDGAENQIEWFQHAFY